MMSFLFEDFTELCGKEHRRIRINHPYCKINTSPIKKGESNTTDNARIAILNLISAFPKSLLYVTGACVNTAPVYKNMYAQILSVIT